MLLVHDSHGSHIVILEYRLDSSNLQAWDSQLPAQHGFRNSLCTVKLLLS